MKNINKCHDLTGQRFGRLTVIGLDDRNSKKTFWVCECECGGIKVARSDALLSGATKSCGCLKKEQDKINLGAPIIHNQSNSRIYHIWQHMKARCKNQNNPRYARYGGRGIKVCEEWENSFESFWEWSRTHGYEDDLTIDRINNDGNYEPSNCRWIPFADQSRNRSTNIKIKIGNVTKTLTEWCIIFDVDYRKTLSRYHRNPYIGIDELFNG